MTDFLQALLLGIIEGITEFLPISSTGHLLIAERWLGQRSELFNISIQAGAILAVVLIYRQRLWTLAMAFLGRAVPTAGTANGAPRSTAAEARDYGFKLIAAFGVTAVLGLLVKQLGWELDDAIAPIAWALIIGGVWMLLAEQLAARRALVLGERSRITWTVAILVGIAQVVAGVFPGTSRSAATIFVALLFGVTLFFFFGLGIISGPLSDRFGRKPILLMGLSLYTAAAVGAAWADGIDLLITWRILQGLAMGAVVMCGRALVRDLYAPIDGARVMSKGLTGLGVLACMSPPLGGFLSGHFSARAALLAMAAFGTFALFVVVARFQESLAHQNPRALEPVHLVRTWWTILKNPMFLAYSGLSTASFAILFVYLASSSFVFIKMFGFSSATYGLMMFGMSAHYIAGTFLCRWLLQRYGIQRTVAIAGACTLTAGTSMGVMALFGVQNVWAIMVPFYLFMIGHGVHQPCGQSGAVGPFPRAAGAASALSGFFMMVAAFLMGSWLGKSLAGITAGQGSVLPMTNGIWFWSVLISGVAWTLVQRYGDSHAPPQRQISPKAPTAR